MENQQISKGKWKLGRTGGTIVTDNPEGFPDSTGEHACHEYYGGYLIAESIAKPADARLMVAAPDMLEALKELFDWASRNNVDYQQPLYHKVKAAIKKATE